MAKNNTLERRLSAYPSEYYKKLVIVYANEHSIHKSEVVERGIILFFEKFESGYLQQLIKKYDKLTPEQIKHPHKL